MKHVRAVLVGGLIIFLAWFLLLHVPTIWKARIGIAILLVGGAYFLGMGVMAILRPEDEDGA